MRLRWMLVLLVLMGCGNETKSSELPTLANPEEVAATLGLPPQGVLEATQTARAPTITSTAAPLTPTEAITDTPSPSPTTSNTPTNTPNPIELTTTAIFHLTEVAMTENAPTLTLTPTPTLSLTPSNTPTATPDLPDNPATNAIVFSSERGGTNAIWVMSLTGEPARPIIIDENSNAHVPACDPQGAELVFDSDRGGDRELYLSDFSAEVRPLTDTAGENFNPTWSPQGDRIAFVSTRTGDSDIWLMDREGTNIRQITFTPSDELLPSWSPDGNVLFYSSNRGGNFDIFQFNLETSIETQITATADIDELYPVLSPDFSKIAYVAETMRGVPSTGTVYTIEANGAPRPIVSAAGRVEMPMWITPTQLLVSANLNPDVHILLVDLVTNQPTVLTNLGQVNRWPRACFVDPRLLASLPETPSTPIPVLTAIPETQAFEALPQPRDGWILSRETWVGDELAFIAPQRLPTVRGFLVENLINLSWVDEAGSHVLTIALEVYQGELASTLIGYTLNDLPGPVENFIGIDTELRDQILRNSIASGPYHLVELEFTDVNLTLTLSVPIQPPQSAPGQFTVFREELPNNWLITTERWTANELALLANVGNPDALISTRFNGDRVEYTWTDLAGSHRLLVRFDVQNGDLIPNPTNYLVNGEEVDTDSLENFLFSLREGILVNSIMPGSFFLSRTTFNEGALEFVFLAPPQ